MSYNRDEPLPAVFVPIRFAVVVLVYAFFGATMALFPAIAVDAEDAGFRSALNDSKYDLFRILAAAALGLLPIVIFQVALQYVCEILLMWREPFYDSWQPALWRGVAIALPVVAGAATLAAMASSFTPATLSLNLWFPQVLEGVVSRATGLLPLLRHSQLRQRGPINPEPYIGAEKPHFSIALESASPSPGNSSEPIVNSSLFRALDA